MEEVKQEETMQKEPPKVKAPVPLQPGQVVLFVPCSQFLTDIVNRALFQPVVMK